MLIQKQGVHGIVKHATKSKAASVREEPFLQCPLTPGCRRTQARGLEAGRRDEHREVRTHGFEFCPDRQCCLEMLQPAQRKHSGFPMPELALQSR